MLPSEPAAKEVAEKLPEKARYAPSAAEAAHIYSLTYDLKVVPIKTLSSQPVKPSFPGEIFVF
jgi:hypothetical protein